MAAPSLPPAKADRFGAIDPLDGRYFDDETALYLSERSRIAYQAFVEAALAQTLADAGICPQSVADEIREAGKNVTAEDVYEEEKTTKHDIKAVVNTIKKSISDEAKPFVHFGATSYDIISTASALQFRDTTRKVVVPRLEVLIKTLADLADKYADTPQIGRTHGQHAVPITFGFLLANYVARLSETKAAIDDLARSLHGKFSGATGSYNALSVFTEDPVAFEKSLLEKVGLEPAPIATQIVPAEGLVRLIDELAIAASIMANLSHDMRHLQRTEISEVRERFEPGQTGSSTMAHKKNPWNFENVISMSKQVTAQIVNANLNISSEHQRDLTDSASSRFYTIAFASVASMAKRLENVMAKIEVDAEAMQRNLRLTGGAIAAEPLYLLLEKYGHTSAHEVSKQLAHQALEKNVSLFEVASQASSVADYWIRFSENEKALIEQPEQNYLGQAREKTRQILEKYR